MAGQALSQPVPSPVNAEQEQRRVQERDRALREQQKPSPDVRLSARALVEANRLPTESNCFIIHQLGLKVTTAAGLASPTGSTDSTGSTDLTGANWKWVLDAATGPAQDDSPVQRCLGTQGIQLVMTRLQNAVIARGFVTTRVLAESQDLSVGVLTLSVIPGRIRAIVFAQPVDLRGTAWNAVPAQPGDILNLRDIEQALENFKRVPTAEADIKIAPAQGPNAFPDESDLLITYKQGFPFRMTLTADDSGTKATGKYQGSLSINYDNFLTLNDLLYVTLSQGLGGGPGRAQEAQGTDGHTVLLNSTQN